MESECLTVCLGEGFLRQLNNVMITNRPFLSSLQVGLGCLHLDFDMIENILHQFISWCSKALLFFLRFWVSTDYEYPGLFWDNWCLRWIDRGILGAQCSQMKSGHQAIRFMGWCGSMKGQKRELSCQRLRSMRLKSTGVHHSRSWGLAEGALADYHSLLLALLRARLSKQERSKLTHNLWTRSTILEPVK